MGVERYVARRQLPGAAVVTHLALRGTAREQTAGGALAALQAPAAARHRAAVPESLRDSLPREVTQRRQAPQPAGEPPATAAPGPRFSVAAIVCAGRLWIEDLEGDALAREQLALVAAIGRALIHPRRDAEPPRVAQFDWPLSDNPQLDLGAAEAAAALHGFVSRHVAEHGLSSLMCLGERACERLGQHAPPVPLQRLPSTRELLAAPARKRDLWQQLRD
jgi:hypothetical protein